MKYRSNQTLPAGDLFPPAVLGLELRPFCQPSSHMTTRREFIGAAPALAAALVACKAADSDAAGAIALAGVPVQPPQTVVPANAPTLTYIPKHDELCYTFGGVAPRHRIKPGTRIVSWTEDCFDGAVKTAADLPSKVMSPGHDNPQTGPFYIEGAEPGDTVAVHIIKLEPARNYGVSSFSPGFGAMVGNNETAMLGPEFPETTWRYDLDAAKNVARTQSRDGRHHWEVPLAPFLGC